uniref:Signal transducer and activator of transcription n=1 Tax=Sinocyclocheilus grahami TaxID=75366 RepID=A0A672Q3P9_SINGR
MTQWERLQQLDTVYSQRAFDLYNGDEFPMEVRHYLAHWIEGQDWERASRDSSQAAFLFQVLLENLDNQFSRFVQEKESFLLQRNFRRYKQNFQVSVLPLWICEALKLLNMLNKNYTGRLKNFLSDISAMLDASDVLHSALINEELVEWKQRQQKSCIGAPDDTSLEHLEKWFTQIIECMFQLQKFLQKLDELVGKMTYENDPIPVRKPPLNIRVDTLLTHLIKSSFVVETQPSMPQGRGLLVLRTNVQFSVKVRLLYKVPELNHVMKVTVSIDKFRKFNVLGTLSKALNMAESMNGGMVADFRHLVTISRVLFVNPVVCFMQLSLSVTEELHRINFQTQFDCQGLSVPLETSSLPVVVISNSSQQQSAWASVLWFNMLCPDPKNIKFFETSPAATWLQFGEMLSWQFLSCGKRGLDNDQLETLAIKLFGKQPSYDNCKITWTKFSKENLPDTNFTLWVWLDGILNLVKLYLSDLWSDGSIMGFISKGKERLLLKKKQNGTFLLRFSESIKDGGITFSWVQYANDATPSVQTVKPFTITDLKQIALPDILCNFRIMVAENIPVNPLCYLYPNTPKDQAFGKYYSEKTGDPPSFFDAGDDDDDVLLKVSKKSPMFSVSTIDADLLSSILDSDGESTVPHAFPPTSPRISPSCLQQSFPESAEYNLEEALSTDNDVNYTLQEFLNGINLHILQEEPDGFILDPGFQDLGNPNIPLTP